MVYFDNYLWQRIRLLYNYRSSKRKIINMSFKRKVDIPWILCFYKIRIRVLQNKRLWIIPLKKYYYINKAGNFGQTRTKFISRRKK